VFFQLEAGNEFIITQQNTQVELIILVLFTKDAKKEANFIDMKIELRLLAEKRPSYAIVKNVNKINLFGLEV
jgi:hypothetical protein